MLDAGYDHPLYSFELVSRTTALPHDLARYVIPIPQGFLTVRGPLLRRAARIDSETCLTAVLSALALHEHGLYGRYGLGLDWAASMRHWKDRMFALYRERQAACFERESIAYFRGDPVTEGRVLWRRLALVSRMAGLGRSLAAGRAPRASLQLLEQLTLLQREAAEPDRAAQLARFGFGAEDQAHLVEVIATIAAARDEGHRHRQQQRVSFEQLVVMRAALIGDLSRLSQLAPLVDPLNAGRLQMGRLLQRKRRPARPVVNDPSPPLPSDGSRPPVPAP